MPPEDNQVAETTANAAAQNLSQSTPPAAQPHGIKKLVAGIIAAVVVFSGVAFLALSPMSPFVSPKPPGGPMILVGENPYIYACSIVDVSMLANNWGTKDDKNAQSSQEIYSFAPDNFKDKQLDILKISGGRSTTSSCQARLDNNMDQGVTSKSVELELEQFATGKEARTRLEEAKSTTSKKLESLPDSFYEPPVSSSTDTAPFPRMQAKILHKNLIITLSAPRLDKDPSGERTASKLSVAAKDIIKRIDRNEGIMPKNYNGITRLEKNPFIDTCQSVNYRQLMEVIGNEAQLNPGMVGAERVSSPSTYRGKTPKTLSSNCFMSYRTKTDAEAQKSVTDGTLKAETANEHPHSLFINIYTFRNIEDAKKFLATAKESTKAEQEINSDIKYEDLQIGDGTLSIRISGESKKDSEQFDAETEAILAKTAKYETGIYYFVDGPYVYLLTNSFTRQTRPYKTTDQKFTDEHAKKVFKILHKARLYAERTVN